MLMHLTTYRYKSSINDSAVLLAYDKHNKLKHECEYCITTHLPAGLTTNACLLRWAKVV